LTITGFFAIFDIFLDNSDIMHTIASDNLSPNAAMLEGFECPAILVSANYEIIGTNRKYIEAFGSIDLGQTNHCYKVSHGYDLPCDQSGESCPLAAAKQSMRKERVLHIHQTPHGREHVDVEMLPIQDSAGELIYFVELLRPLPLASGRVDSQELVGESEAFKGMLSKIARVSGAEASVLLLGESGTGKELAARAIHMASARSNNALVTLECSGLTDTLFETELFGHVKGAFTGANSNKKGLVELADGGTLFLDEVADIPLALQVKLLRLIETGTFRQVGSLDVKRSDFRLICATHKNLKQLVDEGLFRNDLYYRINVFPVDVPALRERREDIPMLARALLRRIEPERTITLSHSAAELLMNYRFEGNIRELRNLLHRAVVLSDTDEISESTMHLCFEPERAVLSRAGQDTFVDLKTAEQIYIRRVMVARQNDKETAAQVLGISLRSLYRKLELQDENEAAAEQR
jgi:transcriptional regulator with PAS, ATPase and Fis domain